MRQGADLHLHIMGCKGDSGCWAVLQIDSARKLRWYDREDLKPLVEQNLRDKQLLHDTVAALRQVPLPWHGSAGS